MIKRLSFVLLALNMAVLGFAQCDTYVSICSPGVSGPFNFVTADAEVGSCQSFLNGINSPSYGYILLNISESGPLSLLIDGNNGGGFIDVSIWNIPSGQDPCTALNNDANEIDCNFASDDDGCNEFGNFFGCSSSVPAPQVNAGDVVMILVEDYDDVQTTFTLELGPSPNAQSGLLDASFIYNDFCIDNPTLPVITGVAGGEFSFNPMPVDGATIDSNTGLITGGTAGTTYTVEYATPGTCSDTQTQDVTVLVGNDPSFTLTDFCAGEPNNATGIVTAGGIFLFNPPVTDGATINASTGQIYNGVPGTSYTVAYAFGGPCPSGEFQTVNVIGSGDASFTMDDFCVGEPNAATITGSGGGTFSFNPAVTDGATIDPVTGEIIGGVGGTSYTVDYIITGACADSDTQVITVNAVEDASFTFDDFCLGADNEAIITGTLGGTFTFDPVPVDGATIDGLTGEISNEVIGATYTVKYTTNGPCSDSQTQDVTITEFADASFIVSDFCVGSPNQATVTGLQGGLFGLGPLVVDGAYVDVLTGELHDGVPGTSYEIIYSTLGSCSSNGFQTLTVLPLDDPEFTLSNFCLGAPNNASDIATPGGVFAFNPSPLDGATINPLTGEITGGTDGDTYFVEYTTANVCPNSAIQSVTITDSPTAVNIQEICALDQTTYSVTFEIVNGDPTSYAVSGAGTLIGNFFTSSPIINGNPYEFTVSDGYSCDEFLVAGDHLCICPASATISGNIEICSGEVGELNIDFTGDAPWTFVHSIDEVDQTPITTSDNPYVLNVFVGGEYALTNVTDLNCFGPTLGTAQVNELSLPQANISGSTSICEGESTDLLIELDGIGPWDVTYAFNNVIVDTITTTIDNILIPVSEGGIYTLTAVNNPSCVGTTSGSANIIVHDLPVATVIDSELAICEDTPAFMEVNVIGDPGYTIHYTLNGEIQDSIYTNFSNFDYPLASPGQYELISITDMNCTGSASGIVNVSVQSLPTAWINGDFTICQGTEQLIPVVLTGMNQWTIDYSIDDIPQPSLITTESPFVIPATFEGNYQITNVSDDVCNNIGEGEANIIYYPQLEIDFAEDIEICIGEVAQVYAPAVGGVAPYQYTWSSEHILNSTNSVAWLNPEITENVLLTVTDECAYEETVEIPITVHQLPPVEISGESSICGPGMVTLINTTPNQYVGDSCVWLIKDDTLFSSTSIEYFFEEEGLHDVQLNVTSPQGCYNELFVEAYLEVYPQSSADFTYAPLEITTANTAVNFYNESTEYTSVQWFFDEEGSSTDEELIFEFPAEKGPDDYLVCLEVDNEFGCADSICKPIIVKGEIVLMVPNTFTPDGDGINELFFPVIRGVDEDEYVFRIYNRIGNLVYETNDINAKWNGVPMNGNEYYSSDGVYNWQIIARTEGSVEKEEFWGSILMIR